MSRLDANGLSGVVLDREALDASLVDTMYQLMCQHWADHARDVFEADLAEKDRVILIRQDDELVGFSTLRARRERIGDREVAVLFSGDTVIAQEHWGSPVLQRCWLSEAMGARDRLGDLHWLLLAGGHLVAEIGEIPVHKLNNAHVAFFAAANPGHHRGDELVCLTRIDPTNFSSAGRKLLEFISR